MFYSLAGHFFTKIEFFFFSLFPILLVVDFPCGSAGKELACNAGDLGSIPGLGRFPGEGKDYPLQNSMDWFGLLAVQGTLKSLLQHRSSKASIIQHSAFFTVQLSHPYMPTGKTITLTRRTFVGKIMSLLLNMLSRLVITFLPRSKSLLISWLQSPSAVILEPRKIKSDTVSTVSPSISHEVMGPDAMIFVF